MATEYDVAQVCLNGHVINELSTAFPETNQKYCGSCGKQTITACPNCHASIRGRMRPGSDFFDTSEYRPPAYCGDCGQALPWTQSYLAAAQELADIVDSLSTDEREILKGTLPDLVAITPRTPVAEMRFKQLMKKAGQGVAGAFRTILIDIVSEAVRKSLFRP